MCRCSTRGRDGMRQWPSGCFVFDVTACGMKDWTRMSPKPYCCISVCAIELALRNAVYEHARFAEVQNSYPSESRQGWQYPFLSGYEWNFGPTGCPARDDMPLCSRHRQMRQRTVLSRV